MVGAAPHGDRLLLTLHSITAAVTAAGADAEIVVGLGGGSPAYRSAASYPGVRAVAADASHSHAAAEQARGALVLLVAGGDILSSGYIAAMVARFGSGGLEDVVVRPETVVTYGGNPRVRRQTDLRDTAEDRALAVFFPPFAPPLAAPRDLLLRLEDRSFDLAGDWRWTLDSQSSGVRHVVAPGATYVAWAAGETPQRLLPLTADNRSKSPAALKEVIGLKAEVEALRSSTSWRITAPLRVAKNFLRGRK